MGVIVPAARLRSVAGVNDPAEWQLCVHPDVHGPPHTAGLDGWLKAVAEPIVGVLIVVIYHILLLVRQLERRRETLSPSSRKTLKQQCCFQGLLPTSYCK